MNKSEKKAVGILSSVMAVRLLGLFMIMPVLSLFAREFSYTTPWLIGLAMGIYGLTQSLLQIVFGSLSDRFGRKPLVTLGLLLLLVGSGLAAVAQSIYGLIAARALQGAGAVGSTILAWIADVTRETERTKAMAILGGVIGISFALALVLGAFINSLWNARGIFVLTAVLALIALVLVGFVLPNSAQEKGRAPIFQWHHVKDTILDEFLWRGYLSAFFLHTLLAATFTAMPLILFESLNFDATMQWYFYLGVILCAFLMVIAMIMQVERKHQHTHFFIFSIILMTLSQLMFGFLPLNTPVVFIAMILFFIGFCFLEAQLPALMSRLAMPLLKGTTLSIYSTAQFLGVFFGGMLGGLMFNASYDQVFFWLTAALGFIWLILIQPFTLGLEKRLCRVDEHRDSDA